MSYFLRDNIVSRSKVKSDKLFSVFLESILSSKLKTTFSPAVFLNLIKKKKKKKKNPHAWKT